MLGGALLGGLLVSIPGVAFSQQGPPAGKGPLGGTPPKGPPAGSQGCPYAGEIRVDGQCVCPTGTTLCGNPAACVSNVCGPNQTFNSATCQCEAVPPEPGACTPGTRGCGNTISPGPVQNCGICYPTVSGTPSTVCGCGARGDICICSVADCNQCPAGTVCAYPPPGESTGDICCPGPNGPTFAIARCVFPCGPLSCF